MFPVMRRLALSCLPAITSKNIERRIPIRRHRFQFIATFFSVAPEGMVAMIVIDGHHRSPTRRQYADDIVIVRILDADWVHAITKIESSALAAERRDQIAHIGDLHA